MYSYQSAQPFRTVSSFNYDYNSNDSSSISSYDSFSNFMSSSCDESGEGSNISLQEMSSYNKYGSAHYFLSSNSSIYTTSSCFKL
ncbi:hypothetical protein TVAG_421430 [Trichomonas vaginalis G3]|uniref:Uncharacterized protein n=1 Tax=Trichomonas vaginalis (strain ATCC PRA-98 / G3) TaxID=412133 RepID=A2FR30_TRIV3|nr:hypothetical protein TVAGG3_0031010 [Trichomonas vaginalis G3]XP_051105443.1 hypothetical protein TVAGG3_0031530 [Trichomonas vaginalis G3]EAX92619.1 hypothetical protein TVAG_421430 [Trichomonas vaginalis G3]KAI5540110.1 hypothetical protein TVAGG3_0031010 [Trichomonas vaginalis G3]KAI5540133.1 hypothetical protein TVAGG3_0031530 [Trichomonas vaginalis G3]|eukprot:XP_001305549.1 hypothetical protein [Trichomonas vaginalis G3]